MADVREELELEQVQNEKLQEEIRLLKEHSSADDTTQS